MKGDTNATQIKHQLFLTGAVIKRSSKEKERGKTETDRTKKIKPPVGFFLRGAALILLSYLSDVTTWKTNEGAICLRKEGSILLEEDRKNIRHGERSVVS